VPEGLSPAEIGADTGLKANTVRVTLLRMLREGEVRKSGGKYRLSV